MLWFEFLVVVDHRFISHPSFIHFCTNATILGTSSRTRKGLVTTSSMPASSAVVTCSGRALAVIAMTGTWFVISPLDSNWRIRRTAPRPSMTGISTSMRIMDRGMAEGEEAEEDERVVVARKFKAARPSSATWTVCTPSRRSCWAMTCESKISSRKSCSDVSADLLVDLVVLTDQYM